MSSEKKKKKINRANIELQLQAKSVFIPVIILTFFAILIGMVVVNQLSSLSFGETDIGVSEEDLLWEKAFLEAEKHKVGIIFDPIRTTELEYSLLRDKCTEFIEESKNDTSVDGHIEVDTIVEEQQYVDGIKQQDGGNKKRDRNSDNDNEHNMQETGPIYFQDMLMIRYINSQGKLRVATSILTENRKDIIVSTQSDLLNNESLRYGGKTSGEDNNNNQAGNENNIGNAGNAENAETVETVEQKKANALSEQLNWQNESTYISELNKALTSMLMATSTEEIREAESLALSYFTMEGKQTVFGNRKDIKLSKGSEIKTVFIEAGKSDTAKTYKDRVYTQLKMTVNNEEFYVYIILKLNSNFRIYDIDII